MTLDALLNEFVDEDDFISRRTCVMDLSLQCNLEASELRTSTLFVTYLVTYLCFEFQRKQNSKSDTPEILLLYSCTCTGNYGTFQFSVHVQYVPTSTLNQLRFQV